MSNQKQHNFDWLEIGQRIVKYFVEGLMVALAAYFIPQRAGRKGGPVLGVDEVVMIGLCAAATFAILDIYAPSVGSSARQGAGFGIGASIVGWPTGGLGM